MAMQGKQGDDEDNVTYCSRCYSLKIKYEDSIGMDCCGDCGCTDFVTAPFEEWERLFKERYGHKFVDDAGSIRKSPMFQMSNDQLKTLICKDPSWRDICRTMYPAFPNWLSKTDSIVLLFAKLYDDNMLDELRMEMINRSKNNKKK